MNIQTIKEIWRDIGELAIQLIQKDTKSGIFQNEQSNLQYKSKQYKKYKMLGMKRLTKAGKKLSRKTSIGIGINNKLSVKTGSGDRLKQYKGQTIESTNTSYVDMTLTGDLMKGLHIEAIENDAVTISYRKEDAGKIEGNQKYGREVVGLNKKNIEILETYLFDRIDKDFAYKTKDVKVTNLKITL